MSTRMNRRRFLGSSAAGLGYFYTAHAYSADRAAASPNATLHLAGIGVGGKGSGDISQAGKLGQVIALCDIDEHALNEKGEEFSSAKKYFDFRKMFDEMGKQIDAVTVSTPDHTHAPASAMAIKMKKHVYCQKPLTHTVYEARQLRELAQKYGVATQMGNQGSASTGLRKAVEFVQGGGIGAVKEAHVWTNRPVWPQAPKIMTRPPESPVPASVHWEEFIGPAPMRPYAGPTAAAGGESRGGQGKGRGKGKDGRAARPRTPRGAYHDFNWRGWWDFGTGALGDMACHTANMAFRALALGYPTSVVATATDLNPETFPSSAKVTFQFPARGSMPAVKFVWYEGQHGGKYVLPEAELVKGQGKRDKGAAVYFNDGRWYFRSANDRERVVSSGSFLVGEKATLFSPDDYGGESYLVTEAGVERLTGNPEKLPVNGKGDDGMKIEWVEAIKGGPAPYSNFDFAAMLTETILLGNIAIKLNGQSLNWDGPTLKFTNNKEANTHLHYEYRKGWTL